MNLRTPDDSLLAKREQISEFYLAFSRYEFALKLTGFVKQSNRGAQVDWDKLAAELGELDQLLEGRRSEVEELLTDPPKRLNVVENNRLEWGEDTPKSTWGDMRIFIYRVQAVRNNLMHGSKFLQRGNSDPEREKRLLSSAFIALSIILNKLPDTKRAFFSPAS